VHDVNTVSVMKCPRNLGDVVAQRGCSGSVGCGGSVGMWWLLGDVVAQWGYGGSVGMWWLSGDEVAQWGCGGSEGMWWLSWLRQLGEPDCNAAVPGLIPASSTVS
jgi:hypothetical protein